MISIVVVVGGLCRTLFYRDVCIEQVRAAKSGDFIRFKSYTYLTGERNVMEEDRDSALFEAAVYGHRAIVNYILETENVCDDPSFGISNVKQATIISLILRSANDKGCTLKKNTWDDIL